MTQGRSRQKFFVHFCRANTRGLRTQFETLCPPLLLGSAFGFTRNKKQESRTKDLSKLFRKKKKRFFSNQIPLEQKNIIRATHVPYTLLEKKKKMLKGTRLINFICAPKSSFKNFSFISKGMSPN
jgi:hypothetical protein